MINNCLNSPLPLPTLASPLKTKQPLSFTVLNPLTFFIIFTNYTERSFLRRSFCHFHLQILIYSEIEVQGLESFSNKMMLKSKYSSIHNLWTIVTSLFSTIAINIYLMFQPNIWPISKSISTSTYNKWGDTCIAIDWIWCTPKHIILYWQLEKKKCKIFKICYTILALPSLSISILNKKVN